MEWKTSLEPVPYEEAIAFMEARVHAIRQAQADELVWLLEHPALYTAGTGASEGDLLDAQGLPVYPTGRGGQYTYHGPGQRIAYVMLNLKRRDPDLRQYVRNLEAWIIAALQGLGVESFTREARVGVWVDTAVSPPPLRGRVRVGGGHDPSPSVGPPPSPTLPRKGGGRSTEAKIAAIGVRIRQWVSYHGIAINVNPDLSHYRGIVPCGIREYGVTSLAALGIRADRAELDRQLKNTFKTIFLTDHRPLYRASGHWLK